MATRTVLITSVGTGVGNAILTAAMRSSHPYYTIGLNTEPFHAGPFRASRAYLVPLARLAPDEWIERLFHLVQLERPGLVIPARDIDMEALSPQIKALEALGTKVLCASPSIVSHCNDKSCSRVLFDLLGLHYVSTVNARDEQAVLSLVADYGFPVVVKPTRGTGTIGVSIVQTMEDLRRKLSSSEDEFVVQEFLPTNGPLHSVTTMTAIPQDQEYSIEILFAPDGRRIGWFASINTLENGLPVAIRTTQCLEVMDCINSIGIERPSLRGPLNIQGRIKKGHICFFEANCRLTGITGTRAGMGFNELDILWSSFVEGMQLDLPPVESGLNAFRYLEDAFFSNQDLSALLANKSWNTLATH